MPTCPRCHGTHPDDASSCPEDATVPPPVAAVIAAAAPAHLERGTMVGEYRVDHRLGAGTFGEVYAGEQPLIGKRVAIKVLRRKFSSDAQVVSRFVAEARAVNRIRHRNIIDIFSFGTLDDGRHYFVMELLDGQTLGELLGARRRLSIDEALPILRGIADALDAAHEAGVLHRDLKPDNVFLATERGGGLFPKLLDFGVAKLAAEDTAHQTATGAAIGTPRYMSPEQCRGKKVDQRTDVYALGAMVHEMLTGRSLFEGDSATDLMLKHVTDAPPSMSSVSPDLPPALDAPVLAMLAKRPNDRPASAGKAIEILAARARGEIPDTPAIAVDPAEGRGVAASGDATAVEVVRRASTKAGPSDRPPRSSSPPEPTLPSAADKPSSPPASAEPTVQAATIPEAPRRLPASANGAALSSPSSLSSPARTDRRWLVPAVAAAGLAVVAIALFQTRRPGAPSPAIHALPATASSVVPVVAPATVTIRFMVSPADAAVLVDGHRAGSVGDPLVVPRSDRALSVRIEREGFEAQALQIIPDRDLELSPMVLARPAHAAASASVVPATATAPAHKAPPQVQKRRDDSDLERPTQLGPSKGRAP